MMNELLTHQRGLTRRHFFGRSAVGTGALAIVLPLISSVAAHGSCGFPYRSVPESGRDVVVVAEWTAVKEATDERHLDLTTFRILRITRSHKKFRLKTNDEIAVTSRVAGKKGQKFILSAREVQGELRWGPPWKFNEARSKYLTQAPSQAVTDRTRIEFFLTFLEHADARIAQDAFEEFELVIPYEAVVTSAQLLPAAKLRKAVFAENANQIRLSTYARMLGLCGNADDAKRLEKKILDVPDHFRLGVGGMIIAYLWLTGEKGLEVIEEKVIRNRKLKFGELYSAFRAVGFLWDHGQKRIQRKRLQKSMKLLLDRPIMFELAILRLAVMRDWSVQHRVMASYGKEPNEQPSDRRAMLRYLIASTKDRPKDKNAKLPQHVVKGLKYLKALEKRDPKTADQVRRFSF